ncbi:hypothetical protein [Streptomyces sp. NBC_00687]|uniref:hypothetical protein n=1 Tax=Streptomyces sp. NBC_00687 TaxID=2975807 RepID=UPI002259CA03|nr:hypothetical protein [Streptomyces sp. NBC_00687]MCX4912872.1 hypothetical protein [Streptomyces sp. NBC_00687]
MTRIKKLATAGLLAALVALAACGPPPGPPGTVVGKDRTYWAATKQWTYKLTTRDKAGNEHEFKVSRGDYNDCFRNSSYPRCTKR